MIHELGEVLTLIFPKYGNIFAFSFGKKKKDKFVFWLNLKDFCLVLVFSLARRTKSTSYCSSSHTCSTKRFKTRLV